MKLGRVKTERWHNGEEGDCAKPLYRKNKNACYFKKGFWKRYDRKKFLKNFKKNTMKNYVV